MVQDRKDEAQSRELKGRHVLFWMLGFFGLIFAVNGVFLYYAITTHPGDETEKSYLQGLNYNQTLAARARQNELGWRAQIGLAPKSEGRVLIVRIEDGNSAAIPYLEVKGTLRRASATSDDLSVQLESAGGGEYRAELATLESGIWTVHIMAHEPGNDEAVFEARKTIGME